MSVECHKLLQLRCTQCGHMMPVWADVETPYKLEIKGKPVINHIIHNGQTEDSRTEISFLCRSCSKVKLLKDYET